MHTHPLAFRIKSAVDAAAMRLYPMLGRRPWTAGYHTRKKRAIERATDQKAVIRDTNLPQDFGIGLDERVAEYPWLFGHLSAAQKENVRMIDAGSILNHDFILRRQPLKGSDLTIMTLAPDKYCQWYDGFSYVFGDLRDTFFKDATFDVVICISTFEHIGLDNTFLYTYKQDRDERNESGFLAAIQEFKRILKPGGICYLSFPFGARHNFGWYQVFDSSMVNQLVDAFAPSSHEIEYFAYSSLDWRRATAENVKNAIMFDVHSGQGRGDDGAASSRAIACCD